MNNDENAPLANDLLDFLLLTRHALSSPLRNNIKDVPLLQLFVLIILRIHGCLNMTQISQQIAVSNQQLTKIVGALHNRGFVVKRTDPENRRAHLISLTPEGKTYIDAYKDECIKDIMPRLSDVTTEQKERWQSAILEIRKVLMPSVKNTNKG